MTETRQRRSPPMARSQQSWKTEEARQRLAQPSAPAETRLRLRFDNRDDLNQASRTAASVRTDEQKNRMNWVMHRIARAPVTGRTALYAVCRAARSA